VLSGDGRQSEVEIRQADLGSLDDPALFAGRHLVTASALLDLVSERWIRDLAARCRETGAAALFAITYDGRNTCTPPDPGDEIILQLFNRHQVKDKGLGGPAAGPAAAPAAAACFADAGYEVERERSDWILGDAEPELQRQLIEGWASASTEVAPHAAGIIDRWRRRRLHHLAAGESRLLVGHTDVGAWL
jgi:hypothetical protein